MFPGRSMRQLLVGTDLVDIARLRAALEAHAPRLGARIFTEREWAYCQSRSDPHASLAARFAAKEALRKIFGQWGYEDVVWRETEVVTAPGGAPSIRLHGTALHRARGYRFAVSLSHTDTLAQAVCVVYADSNHDE